MINSVRVTIIFSFKGNNFNPSSVIDFDRHLENENTFPEFFQIVARDNNIDRYSYEFEVMEMGRYQFSEATGLAEKFCSTENFDIEGFQRAWESQSLEKKLSTIAQQQLSIDDLDLQPNLKQALLQAYSLGLARKQ